MKKFLYLFTPIILGSIIGFIISSSMDYNTLVKPVLSPPGWIFPVMWSIIYLLMGVSYYLIKKNNQDDEELNIIYYSQLGVNLLWSIFFFVLKWRFFTIFWTLLLLALVIYMFIKFYKVNKTSAYLNILYLGWLLFATYLTIGVYILN